jgi:hypothetical protein
MTMDEARKLDNGVYRVWWRSGGSSVAAIELTARSVWIAPANWIGGMGVVTHWRRIERVELIEK